MPFLSLSVVYSKTTPYLPFLPHTKNILLIIITQLFLFNTINSTTPLSLSPSSLTITPYLLLIYPLNSNFSNPPCSSSLIKLIHSCYYFFTVLQMGCCISAATKPPPENLQKPELLNQHDCAGGIPGPDCVDSPPVVEVETVKEVLSETPIIKAQSPKEIRDEDIQIPVLRREEQIQTGGGFSYKAEEAGFSEASQTTDRRSAMSLSETFSMATTVNSENREEDEATSKRRRDEGQIHRVKPKVPRKHQYAAGDPTGRIQQRDKFQPKRRERSPDKKTQITRKTMNARESAGTTRAGKVNKEACSITSTWARRDSGEISRRRSRSPATRAAGGVNKGKGATVMVNKGDDEGNNRKEAVAQTGGDSGGGKVEEGNDGAVEPSNNDSIENPLVSLECFIFL